MSKDGGSRFFASVGQILRRIPKGFTFKQTLKAKHKYNSRKLYERMFGNEIYNWSDKKISQMEMYIWRPDLARQHASR